MTPNAVTVLIGLLLSSALQAQAPEASAPVVAGWFELRPATPSGKTPFAVQGWALASCGAAEVRLTVDGREVWRGNPWFAWPGVAEKYPEMPGTDRAGFWAEVDPTLFGEGEHRIDLAAEACGVTRELGGAAFRTAPPTAAWIAVPALAFLLIGLPFVGARLLARRETAAGAVPALELRVALLLAALVLTIVAARHVGRAVIPIGEGLFAPLANWDGAFYLTLARHGYSDDHAAAYAFFPLYPLVLRLLGVVPLPLPLLGSLVNAGFTVALVVLLRRLYPGEDRGVLAYVCLPFAFFLVAVYSEPLAFVLSAGFLLALRRDRPGWAFALGAAAVLTRVSSLALVLFAIDELRRRRWKTCAVAVTAPFAGLALWMAWLWRTTGDPLRFLHAQESFGGDHLFDAGRLLDLLVRDASSPGVQSKWELFFLFLVLAGSAALAVKGRWGEAGYSAATVLMSLAMVRTAGLNRYALAAFPALVLLGGLVGGKAAYRLVLGLELVLLFFYAARFGLQHWVG